MGKEDDCRRSVEAVTELIGHYGSRSMLGFAHSALGLLELGLGRAGEARGVLESLGTFLAEQGLGEPGVIHWRPDLVEACLHVGARDEAEAALAVLEEEAQRTRRRWALAASARCRGLLAGDDELDGPFEHALELLAGSEMPFEEARTRLCYGARLRRARRRADSRRVLLAAFETFEQLGARPWADRAQSELGSTGMAARRRDPSTRGDLTAKELQIALAVAEGATNREVAAALFLSARTVDTHLTRIYRKLGVRSRTELAHLLLAGGALQRA